MSCHQIQEELMFAFVLNEADELQTQVVRQHIDDCGACRERVETLRTVLRQESQAPAPAASLQTLVPLFEKQARERRPSWSVLRRHPSLAAAAAALLALFFSAGYVQGNLVGRRANVPYETRAEAQALPAPPELGPLMQTASATGPHLWSTGSTDSIRDAVPAVDSL